MKLGEEKDITEERYHFLPPSHVSMYHVIVYRVKMDLLMKYSPRSIMIENTSLMYNLLAGKEKANPE